MKLTNKLSLVMLAAFTYLLSGCDKTEPYETILPGSEVHFTGAKTRNVLVDVDPAPVINIGVGTTDVSNSDRTVTYNISSPSGAVAGTEYSIASGSPSGTVTIPAGQALANIAIQPIAAAFGMDMRDTLIITLSEPSVKAASFQDTTILILRGPSSATCSEDDPTMSDYLGVYANSIEVFAGGTPYGPYNTEIVSAVATGPNSGRVGVSNLWDTGWGPIEFDLDWSDPSNLVSTVVAGDVPGSDAGDLNATYAGQTVAVRAHATAPTGTFSFCDQTLNVNLQLGVSGVGWFTGLYTVTIAR